ncbi:hypothetical protein KKF34_11360 [Myxococcota bacterium]|nr:hypothetical protein [Myxococcota bacterium]MBU1380446.1 hypothetical protein [Myxococcota bacterium]MBU1497461.1 hypothetical protein [Myxococcota bacterium]
MKTAVVSSDPIIRKILNKWIEIHEQSAIEWKTDNMWWYGEPASVSVFSGAVWKLGGRAINDFKIIRVDENQNETHGRCDLYFEMPGSDLEHRCEAKQIWDFNYESFIEVEKEAKKQIVSFKFNRSNNCQNFSIVFITPKFEIIGQKYDFEKEFSDFFIRLTNNLVSDELHYAYLLKSFDINESKYNGKPYYYPGVAVVLKRIN